MHVRTERGSRLVLLGCLGLALGTACGSSQDGERAIEEATPEPTAAASPAAGSDPAAGPAIRQIGPREFVEIPFYGVELDAHRIHECQAKKKDCPADLPAAQFACQDNGERGRDRPCVNSVPDGRCCSFYERVSYNRKFAAALAEHRKQHCANVKCYDGGGGLGRYHTQCSDGRCTFSFREDDLEPIDL